MYSQNQGGDVRRAGAKIRYRLKFVVVQLSARDKIILKKVSLLRVRLSGRPGDVCPGKGLHMHGRTYSSVSRCALVKTAASSASSLLWLRSLRKQREARLDMAAKTKTGRSDRGDVQLSKNKTTKQKLTRVHENTHFASSKDQNQDMMMSYGAKGKARSLGRKSIKRRGCGFCARQNAQAGVRTHLRWRRSQTYCNTSLIHRLLGIHAKSLNFSSFLAHTCGGFFPLFSFPQCSSQEHTWSAAAWSFWFLPELSLVALGFIWRPRNHLQLFAVNAMPALILRSSGFTLFYVSTNWKSCFGERRPGRRKTLALLPLSSTINTVVPDTLFFFVFYTPFTIPPPPAPVLPLPPSSGIHQATREGGEEPINC